MPASYPVELVVKEVIFDEFINEKHWSDNDFLEFGISGILMLGTLYFTTIGLIKQFKND